MWWCRCTCSWRVLHRPQFFPSLPRPRSSCSSFRQPGVPPLPLPTTTASAPHSHLSASVVGRLQVGCRQVGEHRRERVVVHAAQLISVCRQLLSSCRSSTPSVLFPQPACLQAPRGGGVPTALCVCCVVSVSVCLIACVCVVCVSVCLCLTPPLPPSPSPAPRPYTHFL